MIPFSADEPPATPRTVRCGACPRMLTDPESVARGFGPCCAKRLGLLPSAGPRVVRFARVRAGGDCPDQLNLLEESVIPDGYDPEADFAATGSVRCGDCGTRVHPRSLESLPPHRCAERQARRG